MCRALTGSKLLDPLMVFLKEFFELKLNKSGDVKKSEKLPVKKVAFGITANMYLVDYGFLMN